ncbi:hypothetical protein F383_10648 [Gossypium arboreum]|uniref:Uncharacterized protein n=1 Tax=Gossypium arboreum TaxID=29729 RepID=A0A0B0NKS3_GOSAR|nr:hypothetical protein F383_10648 [Gossypium arboreum]
MAHSYRYGAEDMCWPLARGVRGYAGAGTGAALEGTEVAGVRAGAWLPGCGAKVGKKP